MKAEGYNQIFDLTFQNIKSALQASIRPIMRYCKNTQSYKD